MLEKTITDDSTLGIKKAAVKLTLPVVEIDVYRNTESSLDSAIKEDLLKVLSEVITKALS
tara:strand:+ start:177 stop:356 length:180 start_codon:yes stop_codon:yes gene_type:complete